MLSSIQGVKMDNHVTLHRAFLRESFITHRTAKRPFTCVGSYMIF